MIEGLTYARKHAPDQHVLVEVTRGPGGLEVSVTNPVPAVPPAAATPGSGAGLIGLTERVTLAGGHLQHGQPGGSFRVHAWLPWSP